MTQITPPSAATHRYDIVQKGDGKIFVRTTNLRNGASAMLHRDYFSDIEEAKAWIARDKAENEAARIASQEIVLYSEEVA